MVFTAQEILKQERELTFEDFSHKDAHDLAEAILSIYPGFIEGKTITEGLGIRIFMDGLLVYQYLGNDKNEDSWLRRKENTVLLTKHSSIYVWTQYEENGGYREFENDERYVICGGGFPLVVKGEFRGSICVSGLEHRDDHRLLILGIEKFLKTRG